MSAAIYLLYKDMNLTYKKDDVPAGVIYFKKNTAQRCFSGRNLWEKLQEQSPVYKGDRIRTKENSQAFIVFTDAQRIELDENTLIRIPDESENAIDFISGTLILNSTRQNQDKPMIIRAGTKIITLEKNTSVVLNFNSDTEVQSGYINPVLYVKSGQATISDVNDKASVQKVQTGDIATFKTKIEVPSSNSNPFIPDSLKEVIQDVNQKINENEVIASVTNVIKETVTGEEISQDKNIPVEKPKILSNDLSAQAFSVLMPPQVYKITQTKNRTEKIPFYWTGAQKIKIEFAYDKDFNTVVDTERISSKDKKGFVELDFSAPGDVLYWRACDDSKSFKRGVYYPNGKVNINPDYEQEIKSAANSAFGKDKAGEISSEVQRTDANLIQEENKNLKTAAKSESTKTVFVDTSKPADFNQAVKEIRKETEKKKAEAAKIQKQKEEAELKAQKQAEKKRIEAQKKEAKRKEAERKKQLEEQKKKEKQEAERLEKERKEKEKLEKERLEKERLEAERLEKERLEQEAQEKLIEELIKELDSQEGLTPPQYPEEPEEPPVQQEETKPAEQEKPDNEEYISDELLKKFTAPTLKKPKNKEVFTTENFMAQAKPQIEFEWSSVAGAQSYTLQIQDSKGKVIFERTLKETKYILMDDIGVLSDGGTFKWTVSANAKSKTQGNVSKKSSASTLKLDLGKLSTVEINRTNLVTE